MVMQMQDRSHPAIVGVVPIETELIIDNGEGSYLNRPPTALTVIGSW